MRERSVGLGVMGLHSYFQQKNIPFGSVMSKVWNKKIFKNIQEKVDAASVSLAEERGACPDAAEYGMKERFSNKTAIAQQHQFQLFAEDHHQVSNLLQLIVIRIRLCQVLLTLEINILKKFYKSMIKIRTKFGLPLLLTKVLCLT